MAVGGVVSVASTFEIIERMPRETSHVTQGLSPVLTCLSSIKLLLFLHCQPSPVHRFHNVYRRLYFIIYLFCIELPVGIVSSS